MRKRKEVRQLKRWIFVGVLIVSTLIWFVVADPIGKQVQTHEDNQTTIDKMITERKQRAGLQ